MLRRDASESDRIPSTGAVIFSAKRLVRQYLSLLISVRATKAWLNPEFSIYFRLVETLRPFGQSVGGDRRE
jgi:hypothetical protein